MHGAFCDQPWPGNDSGGNPGLCRTVPWPGNDSGGDPGPSRTLRNGDTADTAHTVRLPDVLFRRFISCDSPNYYLGVLPRKNKFGETRNEALQLVSFL